MNHKVINIVPSEPTERSFQASYHGRDRIFAALVTFNFPSLQTTCRPKYQKPGGTPGPIQLDWDTELRRYLAFRARTDKRLPEFSLVAAISVRRRNVESPKAQRDRLSNQAYSLNSKWQMMKRA